MAWYRNDKARVVQALRAGAHPDLATMMAGGPLDELVALHEELGIFALLDELEVQRARTGIADDLLLRTLATLPVLVAAATKRSGARAVVMPAPPLRLQMGGGPGGKPAGSQGRQRQNQGRQAEGR
jgi:hypothetical protein